MAAKERTSTADGHIAEAHEGPEDKSERDRYHPGEVRQHQARQKVACKYIAPNMRDIVQKRTSWGEKEEKGVT